MGDLYEIQDVDISPESERARRIAAEYDDIIGTSDERVIKALVKSLVQSEYISMNVPPVFDNATGAEIKTFYNFARWALQDFEQALNLNIGETLDE